MAKLPRVHQKIFAENAVAKEIGQFGSAVAGAKKETGDIAEIQALEAWEKGWSEATVSKNRYPALQERNGIDKVITQQLAYMFQEGIPEWNAETEYSSTGLVKSLDGNKIKLYRSLKDGNVGHLVSEPNWWEEVNLGGSGLEVCDIGMSLYIDETKGLRRWLNGQIVAINQNTQGFLTRLKKIVALYPSLLTTEENWQAAKTLSDYGQVGKFVFNYAEDEETVESVRLPAVVNVQGLLDLQNLGMTVKAGLPNIEGSMDYGSISNSPFERISGCIKTKDNGNKNLISRSGASDYSAEVTIDASLSNPIYGATDTVQEEAIQYPYYIQIATGQETEVNIRNDIESIVPYTLFDSKYSEAKQYNASWGLGGSILSKSVYPTAYEAALVEYNSEVADGTTVELPSGGSYTKRGVSGGITVKLSTDETVTEYDWKLDTVAETLTVPTLNGSEDLLSDRYDDLELKASGSTYTAPANGWFWIQKLSSSTGQYLTPVIKDSNGNIKYTLTSQPTAAGHDAEILAPVSKGDVISIGYSVGGATKSFRFIYAKSNGSLYFFVASVAQNANLIDAGRMQEQITDLNAPSRGYLVQSYVNGTSGYRVYSDGWCEQWGRITVGPDASVSVTFLKPFMNASYYANWISCNGYTLNGQGTKACDNLTTTSMRIYNGQDCAMLANWYACGY